MFVGAGGLRAKCLPGSSRGLLCRGTPTKAFPTSAINFVAHTLPTRPDTGETVWRERLRVGVTQGDRVTTVGQWGKKPHRPPWGS